MDITLITSQGFQPYYAEEVDLGFRPNGLGYKVKFQYFTFSDITNRLLCRFQVQRYFNNNTPDISYVFDSIASDDSYVDKYGNIVDFDDPSKWGTEIDYFRTLFSYGVNKVLITDYQLKLFNRGTFDRPKNPDIQ